MAVVTALESTPWYILSWVQTNYCFPPLKLQGLIVLKKLHLFNPQKTYVFSVVI